MEVFQRPNYETLFLEKSNFQFLINFVYENQVNGYKDFSLEIRKYMSYFSKRTIHYLGQDMEQIISQTCVCARACELEYRCTEQVNMVSSDSK